MQKMLNKRGFTLIELIVVMAVLAILVLLAAPRFLNYSKDAHVTAMQVDVKVLSNVALAYNVKNDGDWPVGAAPVTATLTDVTLTDIDKALGFAEGTTKADEVVMFDATIVNPQIKGLKNDLGDYAILTTTGDVVYIKGILEDSSGNKYISVEPMPTTP